MFLKTNHKPGIFDDHFKQRFRHQITTVLNHMKELEFQYVH